MRQAAAITPRLLFPTGAAAAAADHRTAPQQRSRPLLLTPRSWSLTRIVHPVILIRLLFHKYVLTSR
jgi:hypothetical protein